MTVNLDDLEERFRNDETDTESYGVYIEMEAFALIRELLAASGKTRDMIVKLRGEVNALAPDGPVYPCPARDGPGGSFYVTELIRDLYERIFSEAPAM
jgi:hypothetical protein